MQMIIDIPEEWPKWLEQGCFGARVKHWEYEVLGAIARAIPIPKHGRLIDADKFMQDNDVFLDCEFNHPRYEDTLRGIIEYAPTVVIADGEEVNKEDPYIGMLGQMLLRDLLKYERLLSRKGFNDFLEKDLHSDKERKTFYEDMLSAGIDVIHLTDGDILVAEELKKLDSSMMMFLMKMEKK